MTKISLRDFTTQDSYSNDNILWKIPNGINTVLYEGTPDNFSNKIAKASGSISRG